ncbi:MAG TPA: S41 family peptidase [Flavobacteriales bacterium]|nr:S41 family peptidase [Flavobacteriales bacterium]
MNGPTNRSKGWAAFYPLMLGVALSVGYFMGARLESPKADTLQFLEFRRTSPGTKLQQVLDLIDRQYVDSVQAGKLVDEVLQNMLQDLDPHSYYISAADLRAAEEPLEGSFMGIGVEFSVQHDTIVVMATIEGGPSEAMGIRAGDRLIQADSVRLTGPSLTNDLVMKTLRGPAGTKVTVGVVRGGEKPFDVTITRGPIPINSVAVALLDPDGTGYIKLNRFSRTTEEEFLRATSELSKQGMRRLVLDLRGNGGGYLNAAIGVCDELLPKGSEIVYTEGRASPRQDYKADGQGSLIDLPLAILIDEGSASASEIVAGAIQDNDRGLIVGRRSFGKGLVQEQINLRDQSAIRLTTARYYTPSGRSIQRPYGKGIDYNDDLQERYLHGEFLHADSARQDSSETFLTKNGRTVYGGGGIMPDIFVPADTADRSMYLTELFFSGALNSYAFDVADRNRAKLTQYGSPERFNAEYHIGMPQLEAMARTATTLGVSEDPDGLRRSATVIALRLKAGIARNIWGDGGYYRVLLGSDKIYEQARTAIKGSPMPKDR